MEEDDFPFVCGLCGLGNRSSFFGGQTWLFHYRAIYCEGLNSEEPRLSGLSYCNAQRDVIWHLPAEAHRRYDDPDVDPSWPWITIYDISPPGPDVPEHSRRFFAWGFRFHESCWQLLQQASVPNPVNIKILWRILRSVPHSASRLPLWGHNFGGLYLRTRTDQREVKFLILGDSSSVMLPTAYHDPFDIPDLKARLAQTRIVETDGAVPTDGQVQCTAPLLAMPTGFDPFAILPAEIKEMILAYVATEDILSFRLSSRVMAALPLSQQFFQSRFWPGRELDVIFDGFLMGHEKAGIDWRELYRASKKRIKDNWVGMGERNRIRIWKQTVRPLAEAIDEISRLCDLRGKSDWLRDSKDDSTSPWKSAETTRSQDPELFGQLQRHEFFAAEIHLPSSNIEAIHVSLVKFFGIKYISGLAFETEDGEDIEIGYMFPGSEEPLLVAAGLEGFHIAADDCGFRAISPYTSQHMQSEYLDWVGDEKGLSIQTVKCSAGTVRRIRATFDGFRMLALYIPENDNDH
ncbi:hypothetical protein O1611_g7838 [Lasiodiplodia mahajangana]|uniref:Uncharacterized protein n=1 Tax=Lasiodiplodia mahajangana TaxID=1108764 RepID=A0ACC2JEE5_9PEZI|nr:hypothetical protein O1611_g7838 [Lasiodiplodia mahajangana]